MEVLGEGCLVDRALRAQRLLYRDEMGQGFIHRAFGLLQKGDDLLLGEYPMALCSGKKKPQLGWISPLEAVSSQLAWSLNYRDNADVVAPEIE